MDAPIVTKLEDNYCLIKTELTWSEGLVLPAADAQNLMKILSRAELMETYNNHHIKPIKDPDTIKISFISAESYKQRKMAHLLNISLDAFNNPQEDSEG